MALFALASDFPRAFDAAPRGCALEFGCRFPVIPPRRRSSRAARWSACVGRCVRAPAVWKKGARGRLARARITSMRKLTRSFLAALVLAIVIPATVLATWPVASRYSYVSQWMTRSHGGIDIAGVYGTKVLPIRSGTTVFAGYKSNCGGYQVWVYHGGGLYSAYYHLRSEVSYRGEYVTGGSEVIGYLGSSGCSTGPHLHLEVWRGRPWASGSYRVNPWNYINSGYYLPYRYR
jgi:murein DD-endopeptidase MepM/ murein hydrolase activator NlpD